MVIFQYGRIYHHFDPIYSRVFAVPDVCKSTTETCIFLLVSLNAWFDSGYKLVSLSMEELGKIPQFLRENVDSDTEINSWWADSSFFTLRLSARFMAGPCGEPTFVQCSVVDNKELVTS